MSEHLMYREMEYLEARITYLEAENDKLLLALQCVSLMKVFPDDEINRMNLDTAIRIARNALGGENV